MLPAILLRAQCLRVTLLVVLLSTGALAGERAKTAGRRHHDLLAAMESRDLTVKVIPRDSRRVTLEITNNTPERVIIESRVGLVAAPVLAQFAQPPAQGAPQPFNQPGPNGGPQTLGSVFPLLNGPRDGSNRQNNQGFPGNDFGNGFFSIPPEKTIRVKLPAVCLEHGKIDPTPRMAYEVRSLGSFSEEPELHRVLECLGDKKYAQRAVQLAAWHVAARMSWKKLRSLEIKHVTGRREPQFTKRELARAKEIVASVASGRVDPVVSGQTTSADAVQAQRY